MLEVNCNAIDVFFVFPWVNGSVKLGLIDVTVIFAYWAWEVVIRALGWFCLRLKLWSHFRDQLIKGEAYFFMNILMKQTCSKNCTAVFFELMKSLNSCYIVKNGLNSFILEFSVSTWVRNTPYFIIKISTGQQALNLDLFVSYHVPTYWNHFLLLGKASRCCHLHKYAQKTLLPWIRWNTIFKDNQPRNMLFNTLRWCFTSI